MALKRIEKLMNHLDMTTVTAPYGATLLRLDKVRFDAFEAAVLAVHQEELKACEAKEKKLPSKKSVAAKDRNTLPSISTSLPDFELMRVMMASNIQDYLKRIPFLNKVPMSRIQMLGEMSQFEVLPKGYDVCQEGAQGDRVFVVIFGQLAVYTNELAADGKYASTKKQARAPLSSSLPGSPASARGPRPGETLLGTLGQGDHFGEMSVLADIPRQATVRTKSSCLLISISRANFRNLMKLVPDVGDSVQTVMRLYMLSKFFHSLMYSNILKSMDQRTLENRLLHTCQLVEAPADLTLIEEGQDAEAFFFVYHGRVIAYQHGKNALTVEEISSPSGESPSNGGLSPSSPGGGPQLHLGVLGPGCYFGEVSILTGQKCRASIVTVSRCMLLKVSKVHFRDIWCAIPEFRAEFLLRIFGKQCGLDHVLGHAHARRTFRGFLEQEHATENLDFMDAVDHFRRAHLSRPPAENVELASGLVAGYLEAGAERQVNVPESMLKRCCIDLEASTSKIDPAKRNAPRPLFDACYVEIHKILELGPFSRFRKSKPFFALLQELRAYEPSAAYAPLEAALVPRATPRRPSLAPPPTYDQQRDLLMMSSHLSTSGH